MATPPSNEEGPTPWDTGETPVPQATPPSNEESPTPPDSTEAGAADIVLDVFAAIDTPRYVIHDGAPYSRAVMPLPPVPSRPLHLCPYCDYNLTGLTTYRCPECGQPFTLSEGRQRALDMSPEMRTLHWSAWMDRYSGLFGFLLLVAAAVVPNTIAGGCANWPVLTITGAGLLSWGFLLALILCACLVKSFLDTTWSRLLFGSGLLAAVVAALFCFL